MNGVLIGFEDTDGAGKICRRLEERIPCVREGQLRGSGEIHQEIWAPVKNLVK